MSDPLAALIIPSTRQDSDGTVGESFTIPGSPFQYRLGSGLVPAYPSGMPLIPNGAAPLAAPAAPTAGAAQTVGALNDNGDYRWAVTLVTKFGETTPSTALHLSAIGSGKTGQAVNIPAATGTSANPVTMRRVYRTLDGGTQLYLVAEIDDASVSSYVDEVSDTRLVTVAPVTNTSGLEGAVTISGASTTWTEQPPGTTLTTGGFIVDYTLSSTGGVITFYSGDAGKVVTVTYSASTLLGSTYFNLIQSGLTLLHSTLPGYATIQSYVVSGGIPAVPGSGFVVAQPSTTAVVYTATNTVTVSVTGSNLTMTASKDTYVDLDNAGGYHLVAVTNGASAPAVTANSIRLLKVVTNGSQVTNIFTLFSFQPVAGTTIQTGTAFGVAGLDNNARLAQVAAKGTRYYTAAIPTNDVAFSSAFQGAYNTPPGSGGPSPIPNLGSIAFTTNGGKILARISGTGFNTGTSGPPNWLKFLVQTDGVAANNVILGGSGTLQLQEYFTFSWAGVVTGLAAGFHTFTFCYQSGGPGVTTFLQIRPVSDPGFEVLFAEITEFQD